MYLSNNSNIFKSILGIVITAVISSIIAVVIENEYNSRKPQKVKTVDTVLVKIVDSKKSIRKKPTNIRKTQKQDSIKYIPKESDNNTNEIDVNTLHNDELPSKELIQDESKTVFTQKNPNRQTDSINSNTAVTRPVTKTTTNELIKDKFFIGNFHQYYDKYGRPFIYFKCENISGHNFDWIGFSCESVQTHRERFYRFHYFLNNTTILVGTNFKWNMGDKINLLVNGQKYTWVLTQEQLVMD